MKFQRKSMAPKSKPSPKEAEKEKDGEIIYCSVCGKDYKIQGALNNHMKKFHGQGLEESVIQFEPSESSTVEDFLQGMKGEVKIIADRKRKRESKESGDLDSFDEEDEDDVEEEENLEEALKAQEARKKKISKLNLERDQALGLDDTMAAGGENTQEVFANLQDAVRRSSANDDRENQSQSVFEEPSQHSQEATINVNNNSVIMKDDEEEELKAKIKHLEEIIENKDTIILDLQVKAREMDDLLDSKDRSIKEKRLIIKLKEDEIKDLVKDKEEEAVKIKNSPIKDQVKEQLKAKWKAEASKAEKTINNQAGRIKNLEKELKSQEGTIKILRAQKDVEKQPQFLKLQKTSQDLIERAEFVQQEKDELTGQIARLKKKIPCPEIARCELGKKCQWSHTHSYSTSTQDTKRVPCIHYVNGRCYRAEKCGFSHDQNLMSAGQRKIFLDNLIKERNREVERSDADQDHSDDDHVRANYSRSADYGKKLAKRRRMANRDERSSAYDTDDTRNFPDPVPAGSSYSRSPRNDQRRSGNDRGAQARRSSLATPREGSGSQKERRGGSLSRSRRTPPPSGQRGRGNRFYNRWDRNNSHQEHQQKRRRSSRYEEERQERW